MPLCIPDRTSIARALLLLAMIMGPAAAGAQDEPAPVSLRATAVALARAGLATGDARALLGAAQLLLTAEGRSPRVERVDRPQLREPRPEERAKADSARVSGATVGDDTAAVDASVQALIREAGGTGEVPTAAMLLRLASRIAVEQNDSLVAGMAAALAASAALGVADDALAAELRSAAEAVAGSRGASHGPIWIDDRLSRNEVVEYNVRFDGGRVRNRIDVTASNPRADLDCYLYEDDKLAARDEGRAGGCTLEWRQTQGRVLQLRVRNNGASTYYVLISN